MNTRRVKLVRILAFLSIWSVMALTPASANLFDWENPELSNPDIQIAQSGGKSLSEAVSQVKRSTNGRILSAETKVSGNREVHHIKVLTKDGKVKTHKIQGRRRGG